MSEPTVRVEELTETFKVPVRPEGLRSSIHSLYPPIEWVIEQAFGT